MKVKTKQSSDTQVEITVTLDSKDLQPARQQAIERLAKEIKLPGFRKGKVPAELAEPHLDPAQLNNTTLDIAVRTTMPDVIKEIDQNFLALEQINVTKYVPGESAEYTSTADVLPEITLGDHTKLKVTPPQVNIQQKDIEEVLDGISSAYAEKKAVHRPAQLEDEVIIDFTGKKDNVAFDGGSAKDFKLLLGSGQFIPGFEDGIVGHESGDRFDIDLTFPKEYHNKDLAGQPVTFNVLLKQVNEVKKPARDDKFAAECGPFANMKELEADIRKNLENQALHRQTEQYKDALVGALVKASTVSAPEVLILDQLRLIRDDITRNARSQGLQFEDYLKQTNQTEEEWLKEARKIAEDRVKASLVLQILAQNQKITVDDDVVDAKVAELRDVYQKSPEALKNLKDPRVRQDIKNRLTIEKTIDFLVDANWDHQATKSPKSTSAKETTTTKKSTAKKATTKKSTPTKR